MWRSRVWSCCVTSSSCDAHVASLNLSNCFGIMSWFLVTLLHVQLLLLYINSPVSARERAAADAELWVDSRLIPRHERFQFVRASHHHFVRPTNCIVLIPREFWFLIKKSTCVCFGCTRWFSLVWLDRWRQHQWLCHSRWDIPLRFFVYQSHFYSFVILIKPTV